MGSGSSKAGGGGSKRSSGPPKDFRLAHRAENGGGGRRGDRGPGDRGDPFARAMDTFDDRHETLPSGIRTHMKRREEETDVGPLDADAIALNIQAVTETVSLLAAMVKESQARDYDEAELDVLAEITAHCRKLEVEMIKQIIRNPRDPSTHRLSACHDMLLSCLEQQGLVVPKQQRGGGPNTQAGSAYAFRSAGLGGSRGSTPSKKANGGGAPSTFYEDELFKRTQRIAEARAEREALPAGPESRRRAKAEAKPKPAKQKEPARAAPASKNRSAGMGAPPPLRRQDSLSRQELDELHAEKKKISRRLTVMRAMAKSSIHVGERSNAQKQCDIADARLAQIEIELSRH